MKKQDTIENEADPATLTLSVPEAGQRYFGLSRNASYKAAERGEIPTIRIGRLLRVPIAALEHLMAGGSSGGIRRFTPDEDAVLTADYLGYVPTHDIAVKLNRSNGVIRQRVLALGLRRNSLVTRCLAWAPDHLKARVTEMSTDEFITACYEWRDNLEATAKREVETDRNAQRIHLAHIVTEIDKTRDMTRNEKMIAKRVAGLTLEQIAQQHGLTRERVRQLTSQTYIDRRGEPVLERMARMDKRYGQQRQELMDRAYQRLIDQWHKTPLEMQNLFIERILADRAAQSEGADHEENDDAGSNVTSIEKRNR